MSELIGLMARAIESRRAEIMFGADQSTQTADGRALAHAALDAVKHYTGINYFPDNRRMAARMSAIHINPLDHEQTK